MKTISCPPTRSRWKIYRAITIEGKYFVARKISRNRGEMLEKRSVERRRDKHNELKEAYIKFMQEYDRLNHELSGGI